MDSNNKGGFTINFGSGARRGTSKSFKDAYADFKRKVILRDSNRKGKNPVFVLLIALAIIACPVLPDTACA